MMFARARQLCTRAAVAAPRAFSGRTVVLATATGAVSAAVTSLLDVLNANAAISAVWSPASSAASPSSGAGVASLQTLRVAALGRQQPRARPRAQDRGPHQRPRPSAAGRAR